ncbi:SGNH/GDSL hydrolase family protein [Novipirellula sp.]|uniref:SGNH/GDSL hydrolase family protein n=1 Tax=Novipirellula sp. TaxID=2795430 RepID=UPI00356656FE
MNTKLGRRDLIRASLAAAGAGAILTASPQTVMAAESTPSVPENTTILFQGDSITDAGRDRKNQSTNNARGLGNGYPVLIAGKLLSAHPESKLTIHNRGISGHKVPDLAARWQKDCLDLKPDVLSILIGVNDIWHKLNGRYDGTVADYETGYEALLQQTQAALPKTRIIICEPFVLRCGAINDKWFPEFDERRAVAKKLADKMKLDFVPFQTMFDEAVDLAPPQYWAADGVHPTLAGHALMAKKWLEVFYQA